MAIELLALFIPIITIVLGVAIAIVWIVTAHRQKVQRFEMRHRERMAAIEKGLELPPEPGRAGNRARSRAGCAAASRACWSGSCSISRCAPSRTRTWRCSA